MKFLNNFLSKRDIEYEMDFPPTGIDYDSWDKRTADKYFKWYMDQIPIRMSYLKKRISKDLSVDILLLDYSPESLILVWDWCIKNAIIGKVSLEEQNRIRKTPLYMLVGESCVDETQLSLNSILIQRDIGMYLAQVFLKTSPELTWIYEHDAPRKKAKNFFNNRPVLTGFVGEDHPYVFEPIHMVSVQGVGVLEGYGKKEDLYDLYFMYSKWLPIAN